MNFNSVVNIYENPVFNEVLQLLTDKNVEFGEDEAEDIACLALNDLPSHYVRHSVDTAYFQTQEEIHITSDRVTKAVNKAYLRVQSHPRSAEVR